MTRIGIYCGNCLGFLGLREDVGPSGGLRWVEKCDRCADRERAEQVEVARLEQMWGSRRCDGPGCDVLFTPKQVGQRFHEDRCRKRAHRRANAARRMSV